MSWRVRLATTDDAEALDRLRAIPMAGAVRLSLVVPARTGDRVVVAERDGAVMAMGVRTRGDHAWDGIRRSVGVLTCMRSVCPVLPRRALVAMYDLLLSERSSEDPDWDLTSILEGNRPARRLLEAGLPGLPRYTPALRLSTLTFASARIHARADGPHGGGLVEVPGAKARLEIQPLRTTRVVGYAPALSKVRPIADRILRALGRPGLPPPGTVLSEAFATEVEWRGRSALGKLVDGIRHASGASGARLVHWGLPADHPDLPWLKARLRAWETRSVVYAVHDPRRPFLAPRDLRVEVARL